MREAEIATRHRKYKEKKPLSKEQIIILYGAILFLFIFAIITKFKFLLFLFVTAVSAIINYQTNLPTIRFNPDPEVFFSLLITKIIGFKYALVMLFVPTLFVDTYTARIDKDSFISLMLCVLINYVLSKFPQFGFVWFAIVLVTIKFVVGLILNAMLDISPQEIIFEHVLGFFTNVIVLLSFGSFFLTLFT